MWKPRQTEKPRGGVLGQSVNAAAHCLSPSQDPIHCGPLSELLIPVCEQNKMPVFRYWEALVEPEPMNLKNLKGGVDLGVSEGFKESEQKATGSQRKETLVMWLREGE